MSKGRAYAIERIKHMIAAANTIGGYTKRGRSAFDADSTVRDAILYQLIVIGEASKATTAADDSIAGICKWRRIIERSAQSLLVALRRRRGYAAKTGVS